MQEYNPNGYNPSTGIYASPFIFQGDWEDELSNLNYTPRSVVIDAVKDFDADKGIATAYLYNSFKSANGQEDFHDQIKLEELISSIEQEKKKLKSKILEPSFSIFLIESTISPCIVPASGAGLSTEVCSGEYEAPDVCDNLEESTV